MVVLNSGDLTAEEADAFKKQKEEGMITIDIILNFYQIVNYKIEYWYVNIKLLIYFFISKLIAEESNAPADLSKKVIFRKTRSAETETDTNTMDKPPKKKAKKAKQSQKIVLSFNVDDDEEHVG